MIFLFTLIVVISIVIFFSCTLPGFLHVTGIHKTKNIQMICVGLGTIFGIHLLFQFIFGIHSFGYSHKICQCGRNCQCGIKCQCGRNCQCEKRNIM